MKINELPINQILEYKLESDFQPLTPETIDQIITEVSTYYHKIHGVLASFPMASMATAIEWKWNAERGTLPKRIATWYYQLFNKKLDEEILSNIGNIARKEIPKAQTYYFDITDKLDWKKGDFGDHQSCFFDYDGGTNTNAFTGMRNSGKFKAIRFFKPIPANASIAGINRFYTTEEKSYIGICRAWMYEYEKVKKVGKISISNPVGVIFNGYGLTTLKVASIISSYAGTSQKYISFNSDWLYINDNGYVIGDDNHIKEIKDITTCRYTNNPQVINPMRGLNYVVPRTNMVFA